MTLLAIDVGNTEITLGFFQGRRLIARDRIPTHGVPSYTVALKGILRRFDSRWSLPRARSRGGNDIEGVIVSSVVPKATVRLKRALREIGAPKPVVLGETLKAPIANRYRVPSQVGQDRLVNAVAACELYGAPAIVVDFGTAVTFDLVSAKREYLGGLIVPGMGIALEALSARAALLPAMRIEPPKELLGRDTVSSMRSGLFYGYGALCDGIVRLLKTKHAKKAKVIATGGHAKQIAPFCRTIQVINPELTLQGLRIISENC